MTRIGMALVIFVVSVQSAGASSFTVNLDPGADGSTYMFKDWFFSELAGTQFDGQTLSVDVMFGKFLVAPLLSVNLNLNQASGLGVWPTTGFSVSGHLLDEDKNVVSPTKEMPLTMQMPGQLHPGWPYMLEDGRNYVPATTGYEMTFQGTSTMLPGALITPIIFAGIHFDITMPNTVDWLVGSRMSISDYGNGQLFRTNDAPISVSPNTLPIYTVPDSGATGLLLFAALVSCMAVRGNGSNAA